MYDVPFVAVGTGPSASPILPPPKGIVGLRHLTPLSSSVDRGLVLRDVLHASYRMRYAVWFLDAVIPRTIPDSSRKIRR